MKILVIFHGWSCDGKSFHPINVSAFAWKTVCDRIPSKENLLKRGLSYLVESVVCSICSCSVEYSVHILVTRLFSLLVREAVASWIEKSASYSLSLMDNFTEFVCSEHSVTHKKLMSLIWQGTIWKIWKSINEIIFKESIYLLDKLLDEIKFCSWKWIRSHYPLSFSILFVSREHHPLDYVPSKF